MKKNPFLISIIFTASVTSCNAAQDPIQANSIVAADGNTTAGDTLQFESKINELRNAMTSYMETAHPPYSKKDIDSCINILSQFIADMAGAKTREEGMILVKDAVQKLNRLNQKCDTQLIETNERKIIAGTIPLTLGPVPLTHGSISLTLGLVPPHVSRYSLLPFTFHYISQISHLKSHI